MQRKHDKKLKKLVSVVFVMMFCLVGCSQKAVSSEITSSAQNETVTENKGLETEAVSLSPKDMTVEEMLKHLKVGGVEVGLPCKAKDLPKSVTLGDGYMLSEGGAVCDLLYNGRKVGSAHFDDIESNELKQINMATGYENETIYCFSFDVYDQRIDCFDILGVTINDSESSTIKKLGEPTEKKEDYISYKKYENEKRYSISFFFDSKGKIDSCMAIVENKEDK